jgi:hypothetical protein
VLLSKPNSKHQHAFEVLDDDYQESKKTNAELYVEQLEKKSCLEAIQAKGAGLDYPRLVRLCKQNYDEL